MTGILGGAFDPPHNGHVELARRARQRFVLERLVVLVSERPGHRGVVAPVEARVRMAEAAFPREEVELDEYVRTVDMLRARGFSEPLFLVGADEFCDFLEWKEPDGVLELAQFGVGTRPGYPRERLEDVLSRLSRPDRVEFFEIDPLPIASRDIRARVAAGEPIDGLVPSAVEKIIRESGLYRA